MSKVFVVSDTWFNRPMEDESGVSVVDYNENLIHTWNEVVSKNDTVYVLGGFGISDLYGIAIQLNGNIHFLDNYFIDEEREFITLLKHGVKNSIKEDMRDKFTFERKQIVVLNGYDVVLSYFPLSDWYGKDTGTFCFHGLNEDINLSEHNVSCCASKWNGAPVDIDEVMDNIRSFTDDI